MGTKGTSREAPPCPRSCEASLPPGALLELLVPRSRGTEIPGLCRNSCWGAVNPRETASYVGLLPLVLGVTALAVAACTGILVVPAGRRVWARRNRRALAQPAGDS